MGELRSPRTLPPLQDGAGVPGSSPLTGAALAGGRLDGAGYSLDPNEPAEWAALRTELQGMRISALRRRAISCAVSEEELDQADDALDRKAEIVRLVMRIAIETPTCF